MDQGPPTRRDLSREEFDEIENRIVATAPRGLSDADFERWYAPRMEQAIAESEYTAPKLTGAAGRFFGNAAEAVGAGVKGLWNALPVPQALGGAGVIEGPVGFVRGVAEASVDQFTKGREALNQGQLMEAAGRFGATTPIVGPMAAAVGEQLGRGDVAGALGQAAGGAVLGAAMNPAAAVRGLRRAPGMQSAPAALRAGAADRIVDVMAPKVGVNKARFGDKAAKIAPKLAEQLDDLSALSRQGFHENVQGKVTQAGRLLDEAQDARLSARTFDTSGIVTDLKAELEKLRAQPVEASRPMREVVAPVSKKASALYEKDVSQLKARERAFMLRWLADDLNELPYQAGGLTKKGYDAAFREWLPGDPEHLKHGIGPASARVGGTPVYETLQHMKIGKSYADKADKLRKTADALEKGGKHPTLEALADAYMEAFTGDNFEFGRISPETATIIGGTKHLKSPMTMPQFRKDPDIGARFFGDDLVRQEVPEATAAQPPLKPEASLREVPLGDAVTPQSRLPRVRRIQRAIDEVQALGPVARYDALKTIRQALDEEGKVVYNPSMTQDFLKVQGAAHGAADAAGVLRQNLAKFDPQTAAANAEWSFWKSADDILKATESTERVRPKVGRQLVTRVMASVFGGKVAGPAGMAAGFTIGPLLEGLMSSGATTKLQTARVMTALARALERGDAGMVESQLSRLKTLARTAGAPGAAITSGRATSPSGSQALAPEGMQP